MYCKHCGKKVNNSAKVCPNCNGDLRINTRIVSKQDEYISDSGSLKYSLWGLFLPFVGLTLYFAWKADKPLSSKAALKGVFWFLGILMLSIVIFSFVIIL